MSPAILFSWTKVIYDVLTNNSNDQVRAQMLIFAHLLSLSLSLIFNDFHEGMRLSKLFPIKFKVKEWFSDLIAAGSKKYLPGKFWFGNQGWGQNFGIIFLSHLPSFLSFLSPCFSLISLLCSNILLIFIFLSLTLFLPALFSTSLSIFGSCVYLWYIYPSLHSIIYQFKHSYVYSIFSKAFTCLFTGNCLCSLKEVFLSQTLSALSLSLSLSHTHTHSFSLTHTNTLFLSHSRYHNSRHPEIWIKISINNSQCLFFSKFKWLVSILLKPNTFFLEVHWAR